VLNIRR